MQQVFYNGKILIGDDFSAQNCVIVENNTIVDICNVNSINLADFHKINLQGNMLIPGLIDIQVNGGGGVLFNDDITVAGIKKIIAAHTKFGTTGCLPTLITDSTDKMQQAIAVIQTCLEENILGVLGIHLEGPYLNKQYKGVHAASKITAINSELFDLIDLSKKGITLVTLAPEMVAAKTIQKLVNKGIKVFAGHTAANYNQTLAALDAGLSGFTHLFNAMPDIHKRKPGIVIAALEDAQSYCGIIADGHHVDYALLRMAIRAKAHGKMLLVTDAMPTVGTSEKSFALYGQVVTCKNGKCVTNDGVLAGSDLDMLSAVRNSVNHLNLKLPEAIRMASQYPAKLLGLENQIGKIAIGHKADLVQLDTSLNQINTWIGGNLQ